MSSKQDEIKSLLDKINLLYRIFEKDGVNKISKLEKELLKEQAVKLVNAIDELETSAEIVIETKQVIQRVEHNSKSVSLQNNVVKVQEPVQQEPKNVSVEPQFSEPKVEPKKAVVSEPKIEKPLAPLASENASVKNLRNIRQIIDLNKSFIFKKELFNDNQESYTSFIDNLNNIQDEEASLKYAAEMASENGWDLEDKTYELVLKAIEKRFSPILG